MEWDAAVASRRVVGASFEAFLPFCQQPSQLSRIIAMMMMERIFAMVMNMPMMITIASLLVNPFNYGELPDEHLLMFDLNYLISIPPKKVSNIQNSDFSDEDTSMRQGLLRFC